MKFIPVPVLIFLLGSCSSYLAAPDAPITGSEIKDHITFLASDKLEGRKPGTPQGAMAADYIARDFKKSGLQALGEEGYQYFNVVTSVSLGENNHFTSGSIQAEAGVDFTPLSFSANSALKAGVVFAGYGFSIETDTLKWDDYLDLDVTGKWVLILRGAPEPEGNQIHFDRHETLRHKLLVARDHEAAGVIFVSGPGFEKEDVLMELRIDRNFSQATLPVVHIRRNLADRLLAGQKMTIQDLETTLSQQLKPKSFELGRVLDCAVSVRQHEVTTQNILGMIPGSDPDLKDEFLLIGAHYDHLGWGGPGSGSRKPDTVAVHNGADDNASGVAAILEIAEKIASDRVSPRRSVLFMAFGAEEMGLLGSKFFTTNPLIDIKSVKQMFNLDMVGRLNPDKPTLTVGGTGTAQGMDDFLARHAVDRGFTLSTTPDGYGPSDHASFYIENIPVLFFFTGITEEYHTPDDDVEFINIDGEKQIADYTYDLIVNLANQDQVFKFQEAGPKGPSASGKRGKVKMGIIPDFAAADANGFLLGGVVPGGPAALAGMQKGDVMISIQGRSIKNVYDYMGRMAEIKPGMRISVEVLRNGEKHILIVQL